MANLSDLEIQGSKDEKLATEMQMTGTQTAGNTVDDVAGTLQELEGTGDNDVFVVDSHAVDCGWNITEDGEGIVVWSDSGYDLLYGFESVRFADMEVSLDYSGGDCANIEGVTQHMHGGSGEDTFVIDGLSGDYGYGPTEDGEGIVVWDAEGNHDLLYGFEAIRFSDVTVDLTDLSKDVIDDGTGSETDPKTDDGSGNGDSGDALDPLRDPDGETVADDPAVSQNLTASADLVDRFVINGSADDYAWDKTDDGGWMVWNVNDDSHDILHGFDQLQFNDFLDDIG